MTKHPITIAHGDGIGPEIMEATLQVLKESGAQLEIEEAKIGEKVYLSGHPTGIDDSAFESLRRTKVFLKAPITTPQGGGFRSLNVTVRTAFGLYANVRPCIAYHPFVPTKYPNMNVVIIRENEEDLYCGIEYRQTPDVCQATKLISRQGSERIIRYAFEYALRYGRKKVTCLAKDNILKMSDGLFRSVFNDLGKEYPSIEQEFMIVDIGMAKVAHTPENFDVVVLPNLYGDILSDITAQISGSVGLVGTSNIGEKGAMFEAIHGSAPSMAGQDLANPSGLMLAAVQMLVYICQPKAAMRLHNAWLKTLEDGIHTKDIYQEGLSKEQVGTKDFAKAVASRMGQEPHTLTAVHYEGAGESWAHHGSQLISTKRELVGVDVYLYSHDAIDNLLNTLQELPLTLVTNRGTKVWPKGQPESFCVDHWRCRFEWNHPITLKVIIELLTKIEKLGLDVIKTEHLYTFDGKPAYSNVEKQC